MSTEIAPVEMAFTSWTLTSPNRMMAPLPWSFSICRIAISNAFCFSFAMSYLLKNLNHKTLLLILVPRFLVKKRCRNHLSNVIYKCIPCQHKKYTGVYFFKTLNLLGILTLFFRD